MNSDQILFDFLKNADFSFHALQKLGKDIAKTEKRADIPANSEIIKKYEKLVADGKINKNEQFLRAIRKRGVRSASGVICVAVHTKPWACPGKCIYCPNDPTSPKSYIASQPAVQRNSAQQFNPELQVRHRLRALKNNGHACDKVELVVMGGSFTFLPVEYQKEFILGLYNGLNSEKSQNIDDAITKNETTEHRCVGLTLETRPDLISHDDIRRFREYGCTRVELGVQTIDDEVQKLNDRGHTTSDVIKTIKLLKDNGFKVGLHMMTNLLGSSLANDRRMFEEFIKSSDFCPDLLKIYPCLVIPGTKLAEIYRKGDFVPHKTEELIDLLAEIKLHIKPYTRIARVFRDIPENETIAGSKAANIRQLVHTKMKKDGKTCECIRCREIGGADFADAHFICREYEMSGGKEYFLTFEDIAKNKLLALLRLRIPDPKNNEIIFADLKNTAIIREMHTYGNQTRIHENGEVQHSGFGRKLIAKAEKIAKKHGISKLSVIAGVGVREYFFKNGFERGGDGGYLTKNI